MTDTSPEVEPTEGSTRGAQLPDWALLIVFGALSCTVGLLITSPKVRISLSAVTGLVGVLAIVLGIRRNRPTNPALWWLLPVGFGISGAGTVIAAQFDDPLRAAKALQSAQLIGFPLILIALSMAARTRRKHHDVEGLLDGLIVGVAFGLFAWRAVLSNAVNQSTVAAPNLFLASALPAIDLILIVALLRRYLSSARAPRSLSLLIIAACTRTISHLVSSLTIVNTQAPVDHAPIQALAIICVGAAALHPSMTRITTPDEPITRRIGAVRIGMLAVALLDTPLLLLVDRLQNVHSLDTTMLVGSSCISIIVVIRLISLARTVEKSDTREREQERRFRSLVQNSSDLLAVVDADGRLNYVSPAITTMLGYSQDEARGINVIGLFHPDDRSGTAERLRVLMPGETTEPVVVRLRHHSGQWRWVEARAVNLLDDPSISGVVVNGRDVTERVAAEQLLVTTGIQQASVAQLGREALAGADAISIATTTAELIRATLDAESCSIVLFSGDKPQSAMMATWDATESLPNGGYADIPIIAAGLVSDEPSLHFDPDPGVSLLDLGELEPAQLASSGLDTSERNDDDPDPTVLVMRITDRDEPIGAIVVRSGAPRVFARNEASFLDTMARTLGLAIGRRNAEQATQHQALHDSLTGLPNRLLFVDRLSTAIAHMERDDKVVAVLFLDIDHFKVINDSLGHSAGDRILTEVAARLSNLLRPGDTVARFGGDEFTIMLDGLDSPDEAVSVAERVRQDLAEEITFGGAQLHPTVSIGIAVASVYTSNAEAMLRDADAAMYRAKESGRDRYVLFDDTMRDRAILRLRTEIDLRQALKNDELVLHYQPVVDLRTGTLVGVEALVRWQHPRDGLILPREFISVAEQSGLIGELGSWVLLEAMKQSATWERELKGPAPVVSINLSARTLASPTLTKQVAEALTESSADPKRICLEITESALMEDIDHSLDTLRRLRDLGVNLAIDDFGTGYSSLTYLKQLPVNVLKIDGSFVEGLGHKSDDLAIVAAVVRLASTLGHAAIAEGVETQEQLQTLQELGCPFAQGLLLGRPCLPGELVLPTQFDLAALVPVASLVG